MTDQDACEPQPLGCFSYLPAGPFQQAVELIACGQADWTLDRELGLDDQVTEMHQQVAHDIVERTGRLAGSIDPWESADAAQTRACHLALDVAPHMAEVPAACDCGGRWSVRPSLDGGIAAVVCRSCGEHIGDFVSEGAAA